MTQNITQEQDAKIQELKAQFEREGYDVVIAPSKNDLPFDLDTYLPSLIARKDDSGLIVEVKTRTANMAIERYQDIASIVQEHKGWRFLLATVDDVNVPQSLQEIAGWDELTEKLALAHTLIDKGYVEPAVLYLSTIFEAAMRRIALTDAVPVERLPAKIMMDHLYSAGYIAVHDYATAKKFLAMRNSLAHGFSGRPDVALLKAFHGIVTGLLVEWQGYSVSHDTSRESAPR